MNAPLVGSTPSLSPCPLEPGRWLRPLPRDPVAGVGEHLRPLVDVLRLAGREERVSGRHLHDTAECRLRIQPDQCRGNRERERVAQELLRRGMWLVERLRRRREAVLLLSIPSDAIGADGTPGRPSDDKVGPLPPGDPPPLLDRWAIGRDRLDQALDAQVLPGRPVLEGREIVA